MCLPARQSSWEGWSPTSFFWYLLLFLASLFISKTSDDLGCQFSNQVIANSSSGHTAATSLKIKGCLVLLPSCGLSAPSRPVLWLPSCRISFTAAGCGYFIPTINSWSFSVSLLFILPPSIPAALKQCLLPPKQSLGCLRKLLIFQDWNEALPIKVQNPISVGWESHNNRDTW